MVLGPSFTSQAKVIAEMAPYYNLLEVRRFSQFFVDLQKMFNK